MMKDYSQYDEILQRIDKEDFYAHTKSSSYSDNVIHRLRTEELISDERQKHVYRLTSRGFNAIELGGFENWLKHRHTQSMGHNKSLTVHGSLTFNNSNVNLLSDSAHISDSTEALEQLENMINLLKENQRMDGFLKERLVEINKKLYESIQVAKKDKLPIIDNLISIASNFVSVASSFAM